MFDRDVPVDSRLPVRDGGECRDRDVLVDGRLPVCHGRQRRDGKALQLPKAHQNEAALQPDSRTSRPAHESELFWVRGGGLRL